MSTKKTSKAVVGTAVSSTAAVSLVLFEIVWYFLIRGMTWLFIQRVLLSGASGDVHDVLDIASWLLLVAPMRMAGALMFRSLKPGPIWRSRNGVRSPTRAEHEAVAVVLDELHQRGYRKPGTVLVFDDPLPGTVAIGDALILHRPTAERPTVGAIATMLGYHNSFASRFALAHEWRPHVWLVDLGYWLCDVRPFSWVLVYPRFMREARYLWPVGMAVRILANDLVRPFEAVYELFARGIHRHGLLVNDQTAIGNDVAIEVADALAGWPLQMDHSEEWQIWKSWSPPIAERIDRLTKPTTIDLTSPPPPKVQDASARQI